MTRVSITLGLRSANPSETRPGIYDYTYTDIVGIPCDVPYSGTSIEDNQSANQNQKPNTRLSFILSNDKTDRLNRISYCVYLGVKYKIINVDHTQVPRVIITLGGTWNK